MSTRPFSSYLPTPVNDNRNPCATADGAYFEMLRTLADLRKQNPAVMSEGYYRRWVAAVRNVESILIDLRPFL